MSDRIQACDLNEQTRCCQTEEKIYDGDDKECQTEFKHVCDLNEQTSCCQAEEKIYDGDDKECARSPTTLDIPQLFKKIFFTLN